MPRRVDREETEPSKRPTKRQRTESQVSPTRVTINVHFDGGSRGNPGLAGAGANVVITTERDDGSVIIHKLFKSESTLEQMQPTILPNIMDYYVVLLKQTRTVVKLNGTSNVHVRDKRRFRLDYSTNEWFISVQKSKATSALSGGSSSCYRNERVEFSGNLF